MKTLTLVAFLLLVVIINAEYQFGDIIAFPRTKKCLCFDCTYNHYAVYVGNESIAGKNPAEDIFHRTGPKKAEADCNFGKLSEQTYNYRDNYLDKKFPVGDHDAILGRIIEKNNNCEKYDLLKNNCEHLATYVRYGKKRSEQHGTTAETLTYFCTNEKRRRRGSIKDELRRAPDLEGVSCQELCAYSGSRKSGLTVISLFSSLLFLTCVA